ncbi:MAG: NAD-dependent deacylase [Alphaproteobacteria bacterium]|nr:MAG: NAD-dependent deacylase [Alphaproteobacteria bacterium]
MAYKHIVILTGAGISADSGLDTFRDEGGVWSRYAIEDVATPEAFANNPELVHDFYNMRRKVALAARPNGAHRALARLEAEYPGEVVIITQNVDNLHEQAGSRNLIHMHGELAKARCTGCATVRSWTDRLGVDTPCAACGAVGTMRPHIVWFGEIPMGLDEIDRQLMACDLFVSIGTSGNVYPAAGFVDTVRRIGRAHRVELNLEPSLGNSLFDEGIYGRAVEVVPAFVDRLMAEVTAQEMN